MTEAAGQNACDPRRPLSLSQDQKAACLHSEVDFWAQPNTFLFSKKNNQLVISCSIPLCFFFSPSLKKIFFKKCVRIFFFFTPLGKFLGFNCTLKLWSLSEEIAGRIVLPSKTSPVIVTVVRLSDEAVGRAAGLHAVNRTAARCSERCSPGPAANAQVRTATSEGSGRF